MSRPAVLLVAMLSACGGSSPPAAAPPQGAAQPTAVAAVESAPPPSDGTHFLHLRSFDGQECPGGGTRGVVLRAVVALVLEGDAAQLFVTADRQEETDGGCAMRGRNTQRRERWVGSSTVEGSVRRLRFRQRWPAELMEHTYAHGEPQDVDLTLECEVASVAVYAENDEETMGVATDDPPTPLSVVRCRPSRPVFDDESADLWLVDGALLLAPEPGLDWATARPWPEPTPNGIRVGSAGQRSARQAATW